MQTPPAGTLRAAPEEILVSTVDYRVIDGVAVITLNNPPVNAIDQGIRAGLLESVGRLAADDSVKSAVLIGANDTFVAGADIKEFGKPLPPPTTIESLSAMEASPKPIVAALAGNTLGGGLEIALAAHWRVAVAKAKLGLPEVSLGIMPGAGGTQRLPRLVGGAKALDMILSGTPVNGTKALELGIVDELVDGDLLAGAIAFARKIVAEGRPLRVTSQLQDKVANTDPAIFADAIKTNEKKWKGLLSPYKIVEAVQAACTLPFAEGAALELKVYRETQASPQRKALTYMFFAEREAAKIPDVPRDLKPAPVKSAAVIGAGTMGGGIAMSFANAGIPVKILELKQEALDAGLARIKGNYATSVSRGSTTQAQMDERLGRISTTTDYAQIGDADIVVEAVFENMEIKQGVFKTLDGVMKQGAILGTNTSTLDIDQIANVTKRPQDVIGMHFFSPANVMKLVENVRGAKTSPEIIGRTMAVSKQIGKVPVLAGNCDGFIGNRILAAYGRECDFLLEEGATPWQIDTALQGFGFPMGLFLMRDMAGLDVGWRIRQYREQFRDKNQRYSPVGDRICELGRYGQKTGAGYYKYEGRNATPDPEIEALIVKVSADLGIERRKVSDEEIVWRVLSVMVNEGAKIVGEGIAIRASDIDVTYVFGYGFPRHQGGPMFWAEQQGLDKVLAKIRAYHAEQGDNWKPAELLEKIVAAGKSSWKDAVGL
jgi:3-hydroxyacyl-CoA dehydrogenase